MSWVAYRAVGRENRRRIIDMISHFDYRGLLKELHSAVLGKSNELHRVPSGNGEG